jgi:DNA-directed RNA polymerase specialized sigma24 family protein
MQRLSYAEAARVMGKTEGQIRGLAYRAKENLKNLLQKT